MEEKEYRAIYELEETHWWFSGLRALVFYFITKGFSGQKGICLLDAGCGTGGLLKRLGGLGSAFGVDYSRIALGLCKNRGRKNLVQGSVAGLPFKDNTFDIITSLDVIYHSGVRDDVEALKEFRRVLKKDGAVMLNLPAYEFLRSPHDLAQHTRERYTKKTLREKLESAGFSVERITYRNTFLFPLAASVRLLKRQFSKGLYEKKESELKKTPALLNKILLFVLSIENALLKTINLPFGLSVFCVARKNAGKF